MPVQLSRSGMLLPDTSRGFGCPQRYIQGPGEFNNVFKYGREYGDKFVFLTDSGIYRMIKDIVESIEDKTGCVYEIISYDGESCYEGVAELAEVVRAHECNVLVGVGGGKIIDTAKMVGDAADLPRIIAPTAASNDAPAADWAAIYSKEGIHLRGEKTRRSTELVLVDSAIIANAPARLFSAGIGDALATWYEAMACERSYTPNCVARGYRRTRAALAVSRECYDILMEDGIAALKAVKTKVVTEAVENVIEANVLLSGLGFINGGLAAGHGLHSGFSEAEGGESSMHGEKVAFALLCQLVLENAPLTEIRRIMEFLYAVDLPVTMEQLGIEMTEANLNVIADKTCNRNVLIHHEPVAINETIIKNSIIAANNMGHVFLDEIENK